MFENQGEQDIRSSFVKTASAVFRRKLSAVLHNDHSTEDVAIDFMQKTHKGQKQKYVEGHPPFVEHPLTVASRQLTPRARIYGYLHDVVEEKLADRLKGLGISNNTDRPLEENLIKHIFAEIRGYAHRRGYDLTPYFEGIDVLTRRSWETRHDTNVRMVDYARKTGDLDVITVRIADTEHNLLGRRNLPYALQSENMKNRHEQYRNELTYLYNDFSQLQLKQMPDQDPVAAPGRMTTTPSFVSRLAGFVL